MNAFEGEAAWSSKPSRRSIFEIGDEDGDGVGEELFESFLAIGGGVGGKAPTADDGGEAGALGFFVVGDGHEMLTPSHVGCHCWLYTSGMVGAELQAQYEALVGRLAGGLPAGEGLREQLTRDLAAAREFVNGVNRAMGQGEALMALLEQGEGLVDRLEAHLYLIQEIGLDAFLASDRARDAG